MHLPREHFWLHNLNSQTLHTPRHTAIDDDDDDDIYKCVRKYTLMQVIMLRKTL